MAMPRGSGKTSLVEAACLWAILFGFQQFVCLIGSDKESAEQMLDSLKMELETNDLLVADFPREIYAIHCLEGSSRRCEGQRYQGKRTYIGWTAKDIVFPTIPKSKASGAVVKVAGLTGRIRGMKVKRPDGSSVRPTLVILDDPQTDESARSPSQCATRESLVSGAILGLAGPGRKIAAVMPCTVIARNDMADAILDREKHPAWNGERTKMVYEWPTDQKLWDEYAAIRMADFQAGGNGAKATAFYRQHRKAMDAGAKVAWDALKNPDELSALQHAVNLRLRDEAAFFSEYQNEPLDELADEDLLTPQDVLRKVHGLGRGIVPVEAQHISAFIDVHKRVLYWMACGWTRDFSGYLLDYGTYPKQSQSYFTSDNARQTLAAKAPGAGEDGAIYAGLKALASTLLAREFLNEEGAPFQIERLLIDSGWKTPVIEQFCRDTRSPLVMPSKGISVRASNIPFNEYKRQRGDRLGHNWRIPNVRGKQVYRHVAFDSNYWKSFLHDGLKISMGDKGAISLFADADHRMLADHIARSEYKVRTSGRGREVDEWQERPEHSDGHLFDCGVGCCVAASMLGCRRLDERGATNIRQRKRLSDLQKKRRRRA